MSIKIINKHPMGCKAQLA